jgi:hypothetical protein
MKKWIGCLVAFVALLVAGAAVAQMDSGPYHILHKDGAIYNSDTGWIVTTPPYYPGTDWAADFLYSPEGVSILHRDGALWNESSGWIVTAPPYYPGTGYARALNYTTSYGYSSATSGSTYGVWGKNASTDGRGVYGLATATTGANYGVYGSNASIEGYGVYGKATAINGFTYGVYGQSASLDGRGVYGLATATTGMTFGVYGRSASVMGSGVFGHATDSTGNTYGVYGESDSTAGYGVYGSGNYGVYGRSASTDGRGVYGRANDSTGNNYGVYGESKSTSGYGVYGTGYYGVYGYSASTDGRGVYGIATATSGATVGVNGQSDSTSGYGLYGSATATSGTTYGVYGYSVSTAGYDFYAGGNGNYAPFTGAHEAKLAEDFPKKVEPGLIVVATGKAQRRQNADGTVNLSSTLPTIKLADQPQDKAVFGVLVGEATLPKDHWYEAQEGERFATVNALGEGRVWVTDGNGAIEAGDYITTSAIPGYGQRQDDDLVHSYTLGKAIETVDWDQVIETVKINGKTYKVYLIAVVYTSG